MSELAAKLNRRNEMIETGVDNTSGSNAPRSPGSLYSEFPEFSRKQMKQYQDMFKKYDEDRDGTLNLEEMKKMMEKLGNPQTHITLKNMIKEVDEDGDGSICLREFLLIFRKAAAGTLSAMVSGAFDALVSASQVEVAEVGVGGAAKFFEAKAKQVSMRSNMEKEIKAEQQERKVKQAEAAQRKNAFKNVMANFQK
jgi:hypothetical protein